jgi:hypothetical protein
MGRGRIQWENIASVEVPKYTSGDKHVEQLVSELENLWAAYERLYSSKNAHLTDIISSLNVNGDNARLRWLSFKPPE